MKNFKKLLCLGVAISFGIVSAQAQETKKEAKPEVPVEKKSENKEIKIQKRTLMDKFEADYVLPVEERKTLKEDRISYQKNTKKIIDTMDISDRKRRKLMRELKRNPFSIKVKEATAETKFEDDPEEN